MMIYEVSPVSGQENSGIRLSNFGGINSVHLNPSGLVNSKLFFDFNLVSGNISFENNFLFIHRNDFRLGNFLKPEPVWPSLDTPGEGLDYDASVEFIRGFIQTDFYGPSMSLVLGNHAAGIFTRAVTMTSISDLPGYLGKVMFEGLEYEPLHNIPQNNDYFDVAATGWWEWGLSYAWRFYQKRQNNLSLGLNIRRLYGYAGLNLYSNNTDYTIINDEFIDIRNLDATILMDLPLDYTTTDFPAQFPGFTGRGTVLDFGITYAKNKDWPENRSYMKFCQKEFQEYHYKIGISLLGLGSLNFSKNLLQQHYDNVSVEWNEIDTIEFTTINNLAQQISEIFYNDPDAADINGNTFRLGMPTTLSLQGDFNYFPGWHLAGLLSMPVQTSPSQIRKPAQAMLSLRYETPAIEVALPVSLYDFEKPRIGLSARIYYLTIGTDKLGGFFGFDDFYGLDFYFSLKFHLMKGSCQRFKPAKDCRNYRFN
jgi:hypothetical protein